MRTLPFLVLLLLAGIVYGQEMRDESESEGMKRILSPPLNPATGLQDKAFYEGAGKGFSTKEGNVKTFHWTDVFRMKTYAGTKKFGAKDYWTGEYESGGKKARTEGNFAIPNKDSEAAVRTAAVKEDRDARKTQETREWDKSRPFLVQGKAQKALDSQQEVKKPMTVDDVRTLLNTTR